MVLAQVASRSSSSWPPLQYSNKYRTTWGTFSENVYIHKSRKLIINIAPSVYLHEETNSMFSTRVSEFISVYRYAEAVHSISKYSKWRGRLLWWWQKRHSWRKHALTQHSSRITPVLTKSPFQRKSTHYLGRQIPAWYMFIYNHSIVCLTTGLQLLAKPVLQTVRSSISLTVYSIPLFPEGHTVATYVFFLVFPPLLSFIPSSRQSHVFQDSSYARCDQFSLPSFV
jgi:hypothetical protein